MGVKNMPIVIPFKVLLTGFDWDLIKVCSAVCTLSDPLFCLGDHSVVRGILMIPLSTKGMSDTNILSKPHTGVISCRRCCGKVLFHKTVPPF